MLNPLLLLYIITFQLKIYGYILEEQITKQIQDIFKGPVCHVVYFCAPFNITWIQ